MPTAPLLVLLAVVTAISAAEPLASPMADAGWGQAAIISAGSFGASAPDLAMDAAGNAMAVWVQFDGVRVSAYAAYFSMAFGWAPPTRIELSDAGDVSAAFVGMDVGGNATGVWHQFDGTRFRTYGNRFAPGVGWGTAAVIDNPSLADSAWPDVGADGNGNAIAVFRQFDGTATSILANRYVAGTGWTGPSAIEAYPFSSDDVQIAIAPNGEATAVWRQWDGSANSIAANRFSPGIGWGTATYIEGAAGEAIEPRVAMDTAGAAIAVWRELNGTARSVYANRFTPGAGWGTPQALETDDRGDAMGPRVAMDPAGNAVATWSQSDGVTSDVLANRYAVGSGWGSPLALETASGFAGGPLVALDPDGNAVVTWLQMDGSVMNLYANRYRSGVGWGTRALVEMDNQGGAGLGGLGMDVAGNAIAVWPQTDGAVSRAWANRYVRDVVPPSLVVTSPSEVRTNNSSVTVAGTTEPGARVTISGTPASVSADGSFSTVRTLTEGANVLVVVATDDEGNANTVARSIVLDTVAPALVVLSPADGATTDTPTVTVTGATEVDASLVVNGLLVAVASDGTFALEVALHEGSNTIATTATDPAGNARAVSVSVTYTNPLPALQNALSNLTQELGATRGDLAAIQDDLGKLRDALTTTNESLLVVSSQVLLMTVLLAVLVAAVGAQFLLYWSLRKRLSRGARGWAEAQEPRQP